MSIRPDGINFLSTLPNYINIGNPTGDIVISGSIPDGGGQVFSVTISVSRQNTRSDIYGTNTNTGIKQLLSGTNFPVIYQNAGGEAVNSGVLYGVDSITVEITVENNTGSPVLLIDQTIGIQVVEYSIPY
jgi:hypothetical protein